MKAAELLCANRAIDGAEGKRNGFCTRPDAPETLPGEAAAPAANRPAFEGN